MTQLCSSPFSGYPQANIVLGSGSLIGRILSLPSTALNVPNNRMHPLSLSSLQEERLRNLRHRLEVPFDGSKTEHQVCG
ncbi:hypothetical protein HN873_063582 [Arachis hypogaea]